MFFLYDIDISFSYENLVIKIINEQLEEYNFSLCTLNLIEKEQIIKEYYKGLCSIINKNSIEKNKKYIIKTKENVEEENEFLFSNI